METLKKAFSLLDGFSALTPLQRSKRFTEIERMISRLEIKKEKAVLLLRELDQLHKQHAHMLVIAGRVSQGLDAGGAIVQKYEQAISDLHDEASFQLAEASLVSFKNSRRADGVSLALQALRHAADAKRVSRTLLNALQELQSSQEAGSRSASESDSGGTSP